MLFGGEDMRPATGARVVRSEFVFFLVLSFLFGGEGERMTAVRAHPFKRVRTAALYLCVVVCA